jgi:hypothetical protein
MVPGIVERALADGGGILRLEAAWVAREWTAPGRRLGLPEERVVVGERGWICERWLGSTTRADHRIGPDDEGLSCLALDGGHRITLRDPVKQMPETSGVLHAPGTALTFELQVGAARDARPRSPGRQGPPGHRRWNPTSRTAPITRPRTR